MPQDHTIFLYGTLRPRGVNHHMMRGARHLGPAITAEPLVVYDLGGYPGALRPEQLGELGCPADAPRAVHLRGDLYAVSANQLDELDRFEQHPLLYRRQPVLIQHPDEPCPRHVDAWLIVPRAWCATWLRPVDGDCWIAWTERAHATRRTRSPA